MREIQLVCKTHAGSEAPRISYPFGCVSVYRDTCGYESAPSSPVREFGEGEEGRGGMGFREYER